MQMQHNAVVLGEALQMRQSNDVQGKAAIPSLSHTRQVMLVMHPQTYDEFHFSTQWKYATVAAVESDKSLVLSSVPDDRFVCINSCFYSSLLQT